MYSIRLWAGRSKRSQGRKQHSDSNSTALVYRLPAVAGMRPSGPPQRGGQLRALWFERGQHQYTVCIGSIMDTQSV